MQKNLIRDETSLTEEEIEERSKNIQKIEEEMKILNELMQEAYNLTLGQKTMVENIETNVENSLKSCQEGKKELEMADKNLKTCIIQ